MCGNNLDYAFICKEEGLLEDIFKANGTRALPGKGYFQAWARINLQLLMDDFFAHSK